MEWNGIYLIKESLEWYILGMGWNGSGIGLYLIKEYLKWNIFGMGWNGSGIGLEYLEWNVCFRMDCNILYLECNAMHGMECKMNRMHEMWWPSLHLIMVGCMAWNA
jgi:hypothetical protein